MGCRPDKVLGGTLQQHLSDRVTRERAAEYGRDRAGTVPLMSTAPNLNDRSSRTSHRA